MNAREIRDHYELGRSNGYADGAFHAQWHREEIGPALGALGDELRHARDYVQVSRARAAQRPSIALPDDPRRYRAYHVGYSRGYREAVGVGGRT